MIALPQDHRVTRSIRPRECASYSHVKTIPETAVLTYSFDQGYEKLDYQEQPEYGGIHFAGSYHPDGYCDGPHICSYCGRTMFDGD